MKRELVSSEICQQSCSIKLHSGRLNKGIQKDEEPTGMTYAEFKKQNDEMKKNKINS